jgi:hypothetical protein
MAKWGLVLHHDNASTTLPVQCFVAKSKMAADPYLSYYCTVITLTSILSLLFHQPSCFIALGGGCMCMYVCVCVSVCVESY